MWIVIATATLLALALGLWCMQRRGCRREDRPRGQDKLQSEAFRPRLEVDVDSSALTRLSPSGAQEAYWLVLDTETFDAIDTEQGAQGAVSPIVALSWQLLDRHYGLIEEHSYIVRRSGTMTDDAVDIHGISNAMLEQGETPQSVYSHFATAVERAAVLVAHNLDFHLQSLATDLDEAHALRQRLYALPRLCTMHMGRDLGFKVGVQGHLLYPRLDELFGFLYFQRPTIKLSYSSKTLRDVRLVSACLRALG